MPNGSVNGFKRPRGIEGTITGQRPLEGRDGFFLTMVRENGVSGPSVYLHRSNESPIADLDPRHRIATDGPTRVVLFKDGDRWSCRARHGATVTEFLEHADWRA
ncbi:MAG: hypothetical protein K1X83_02620 [Oligoflexia bacterium]|nr:hypothetical protein [Oligoflexia bacterium]